MKNKIEYVVTDPFYILPLYMIDECIELYVDERKETKEKFIQALNKALTKYTGNKAWTSFTGYGDWNNEIFSKNIIQSFFCADAGLVCVCRLTDTIKNKWKARYYTKRIHGAAVFKMSEDIDVNFDKYPDWTVVNIKDMVTGNTISSMSYDEACENIELQFKSRRPSKKL